MYIYIQQGEYLKENTKSLHSKITANLTVNFFFSFSFYQQHGSPNFKAN